MLINSYLILDNFTYGAFKYVASGYIICSGHALSKVSNYYTPVPIPSYHSRFQPRVARNPLYTKSFNNMGRKNPKPVVINDKPMANPKHLANPPFNDQYWKG